MIKLPATGLALLSLVLVHCTSSGQQDPATKDSTTASTPGKTGEGPDARYTVTEHSFGLVPLDATYETLLRTYGKERVTDENMYRAPDSDEMVMKTIINKGKRDEIVIQWDDSSFHQKILAVEAGQENHPFKTSDGVHYGTTLAELVTINGASISFSGFGWDFGGLLTDFHGGKLAYKEGLPHISYDLGINLTQQYDEIMGDQIIDTDMPKAKKYLEHIVVKQISLMPAL
ncbi:MAG: hypothetical protein NTW29_15490 [Bacteroidetes bacterium]|nr:hypothetical protein [Bacteroidota bacterium]